MKFTLVIELGKPGAQTVGDIKHLLECAMDTCTASDETPLGRWSYTMPSINGNTVGKWEVTE